MINLEEHRKKLLPSILLPHQFLGELEENHTRWRNVRCGAKSNLSRILSRKYLTLDYDI